MNKIISKFLILVALFVLVSCGGGSGTEKVSGPLGEPYNEEAYATPETEDRGNFVDIMKESDAEILSQFSDMGVSEKAIHPTYEKPNSIVGTTKGEFSVNQGTANYALKIDVPPGVAGMEPELSLNYSSSGANGYMGLGWGIGGESAISRCSQTKAIEGDNRVFGIKNGWSDKFCLDGQRLIVVNGFNYGADGAEYRTEINNYSKVTSKGYSGNGPSYFVVKTKSGLIYTYASFGNASLETADGTKRFWKVSTIEDTYKNTIIFNYAKDNARSLHYLKKVVYADNSVEFHYRDRSDTSTMYQNGYKAVLNKLLKKVTVKTGNKEIRNYKIDYTNESAGAKRSKVSVVTEVTPQGSLKPVYFGYSDKGELTFSGFESPVIRSYGAKSGGWSGEHSRLLVDVNGDGMPDIVGFGNRGVNISLNKSKTISNEIKIWVANFGVDAGGWHEPFHPREVIDLNGDGLPDIAGFADGGVYVALNTGTSFTYNATPWIRAFGARTSDNRRVVSEGNEETGWKTKKDERVFADVNGDGYPDIVGFGNEGTYVSLNNKGTSFLAPSKWHTSFSYKDGWRTENHIRQIVDMNGDGLPDIVGFGNAGVHIVFNSKAGFNAGETLLSDFGYSQGYRKKINPRFVQDVNGDGYPDIVAFSNDGVHIALNKGNGHFENKGLVLAQFGLNQGYQWGHTRMLADMNGDGLPDIIAFGQAGVYIALNDGHGHFIYDSHVKASYFGSNHGWTGAKHIRTLADINGDGALDIVGFADDGVHIATNHIKSSYLTSINNNTDQTVHVDYKLMTDKNTYVNYGTYGQKHPFNSIANGNLELTLPMPLVRQVRSRNGNGGFNATTYTYYGYIINKQRGSQGFHKITKDDVDSKIYTETEYQQLVSAEGTDFQYTGMPTQSFTRIDGKLVSITSMAYKDASHTAGLYEPYTYSNIETIFDPVTQKNTKNVYHYNTLFEDGLGNIASTTDSTHDHLTGITYAKTTQNEYQAEDKENWHIGRLTKATVSHAQKGIKDIRRVSTFKYNNHGILTQEVTNADSSVSIKKVYSYDNHGNKVKETVSGGSIPSISTTYRYDASHKFQIGSTNTLGFSESKTYDPAYGALISHTGPNGLTTRWAYDALGRKTRELRADGSVTYWTHKWSDKSRAVYSVEAVSSGAPKSIVHYDAFARDIFTETTMLGKRVYKLKTYNNKGELTYETLPSVSTEDPKAIYTYYDVFGRVIKTTKPGPSGKIQVYTTTYDNFTQVVTDPKGMKKRVVKNAIDQTMQITDAFGTGDESNIHYTYDAIGNLVQTIDTHGNTITMAYDAQGNKTSMNDPDLGEWLYTYDAMGRLIEQENSQKQVVTKKYDAIGRVVETKSRDSHGHTKTNYYYATVNAAAGTRGKLVKTVKQSTLNAQEKQSITKMLQYNQKGQVSSTKTFISGRGEYDSRVVYDAYSRPVVTVYPNGYKAAYHYNNGIVDYVKGSDGKVHYKIDSLTPFGEIASAQFGNGVKQSSYYDEAGFLSTSRAYSASVAISDVQRLDYRYDLLGNVISRSDTSISGKYIGDVYTYDSMNRLTSQSTESSISTAPIGVKTYRYDALGNMTFQTGIGNYTYHINKPHAVKSAGNRTYTYDNIGNVISRNGDTFSYTPNNKTAIIHSKDGKEVRFSYDESGNRYMKRTEALDTYYLGKGYEEQVDNEGYTKEIAYISMAGKTIGTHTETSSPYKAKKQKVHNNYFHTDALGSITAITDGSGKVIERRSYDAFGKIRAMDYGVNDNTNFVNRTINTTRGYTGHEQISEISGLVNMNARIYDSDIGRFLSADTIIQDPHDSQAYNRYSYVRNNPMVFTDPSGHSWLGRLWGGIKRHWRTILSIVISAVIVAATMGYGALSATWVGDLTAIQVGGLAGGISGGIMSGSLTGAIKGALFGVVSAGIAQGIGSYFEKAFGLKHGATLWKGAKTGVKFLRAASHGLSRGIISIAQGGSFKSGFASGFTSSFFSPGTELGGEGTGGFTLRTSIAAIVGGTASKVGGGKFSNGAVSAAFVHMFNAEGIGQKISNLFAGFGDSISFGATSKLRQYLGWDYVDYDSGYYQTGTWGSVALGGARLTYAGLAKGSSLIGSLSAKQVFKFRNLLKKVFRLNPFSTYRIYTYEQVLGKYGSEAAVKAAAGRTNSTINSFGAMGFFGGLENDNR